ncbi:MAG: hypothetical protein IKV03_04350 [Alphaproteobacteria bacterium]|nr:hypothetical protein [Alphaproteobacteria bacterium]
MSAKEKLFTIYQKLYAQRTVLTEAPSLTIDITTLSANTMDYNKVRSETSAVISYLMGIRNIDKIEVKNALGIIEKNYSTQPFWKNLILEYLSFANEEEAENLFERAEKARQNAEEILFQIQQQEANEKATIQAYAKPLKENNFAIDGEQLIRNYLNMCRKDPKKAWEILISNPGWFSPIITTNKNGDTILTPKQAIEENQKIGNFLKRLSI